METKTTKQLARELGLLRKRKVCSSPNAKEKKRSKNDQIFSYLVVMDFESTCWENDKTLPQEVIEFPAVLLNCNSGHIESTFHHYVLPSERPRLSEFCQKLTGISQSQVDGGVPLSFCLRKFFYWLKKLQTDKGIVCVSDKHFAGGDNDQPMSNDKLAAFMTWSDWDLGVCLLNETRRKQIMKPSVLDRWIDLRATYRKFYGRRPDGLNGAMKDLGLQFDGREHSGIDDAKNTARLAHRMMRDGCLFHITKSLKTNATATTSFSNHKKTSTIPIPCPVADVKSVKSPSNKPQRASSSTVKSKRGISSFTIMEDGHTSPEGDLQEGKSFIRRGLSLRSTNITTSNMSSVLEKSCLSTERLGNGTANDLNKIPRQSFIPSLSQTKSALVRSETFVKPPVTNSYSAISSSSSTSQPTFKSPQNRMPQFSKKLSNNSTTKKTLSLSAPFKSPVATTQSYSSSSSSSFKSPTNTIKPPSFKTPTPPAVRPSNNTTRKTPPPTSSSLSSSSPLETQTTCLARTTPVSSSSSPYTSLSRKSPTTTTARSSGNPGNTTRVTPLSTTSSSSFKTPTTSSAIKHSTTSRMRVTPPLCTCGRRSRRRLVQNPGPNEGRWFFSCTASNRSHGSNSFNGCGFFLWEPAAV